MGLEVQDHANKELEEANMSNGVNSSKKERNNQAKGNKHQNLVIGID